MDVVFDYFDEHDRFTIDSFIRESNLSIDVIACDLGYSPDFIFNVFCGYYRPNLKILVYLSNKGLYLLENYNERLKRFYYENCK